MITYSRADPAKLRANVPPDMRKMETWLLWKQAPAKKKDDKPKKVPYYADGRVRGTTDTAADRERLVSFDYVMDIYEKDQTRYMGPGFALGQVPDTALILSGIDPDNSVTGGRIAPQAQKVLDATASYAEFSPSGTGCKIFGTGDIGTEKSVDLEIYSGGRFFTVTGEKIQGDHLADLEAAATLAREILLRHDGARKPAAKVQSAIAADILSGQRNNGLYALACSLRGRDVPKADAWRALKDRNAQTTPPLDERELKQLFYSAWKRAPGFPLTDLGNAERLVAQYGDSIRYLTGGGWFTFDGHRYAQDRERRLVVMMGETARGIFAEAAAASDKDRRKALASWATQSESRGRIESAISLAEPRVAEPLDQYDCNPLLIGLQNGVYDLERDEFRAGRPDDRITLAMNVSYDAEAKCPRWEQFQREIHSSRIEADESVIPDATTISADEKAMKDDAAMVAFKRRLWGYTMTGDVSEQKLFMPFGDGANGKTTEQNVMLELHGDYGRKIAPETLLVRKGGGATNDIARLRGARFVATVEVEDGRQLAESITKQLTGRDKMTARFLYEEYIEFKPTWKLWIATNHKPEITGTDFAIWRRIVLIPYLVRFTGDKCDPHVEDKLLNEAAGIFNWMIEGYRQWKMHGLSPPDTVTGATEAYKAEMDRVGNFLRECCKHGLHVKGPTAASRVYQVYRNWMKAAGWFPMSAKKFHERMKVDHNLHRIDGKVSEYPNVLLTTPDYDDDPTANDISGM